MNSKKQVFLENPKRSKRALKIQPVEQRLRQRFLEKNLGAEQFGVWPENLSGRNR